MVYKQGIEKGLTRPEMETARTRSAGKMGFLQIHEDLYRIIQIDLGVFNSRPKHVK